MTDNCNKETFPDANSPDFPFRLITATYGIADSRTPVIERGNYEDCTVEFVYKGSGFLEINNYSYTPQENSIYILHKNSNHKYWPDKKSPWEKIFFVINGNLMEYLFKIYKLDRIYHIADCPQLRKYFDEMIQLRHSIGAINRQASIIFHRFLEECHTSIYGLPNCYVPAEILKLKNYLDTSIGEKINLDEYCGKIHRSTAHMIRQFKGYFGVTPYDYLMQKRIEEARLLLKHSALSVKEIAARLKFSDQYYFSNYFKRKTGLSPQKYKKEMMH